MSKIIMDGKEIDVNKLTLTIGTKNYSKELEYISKASVEQVKEIIYRKAPENVLNILNANVRFDWLWIEGVFRVNLRLDLNMEANEKAVLEFFNANSLIKEYNFNAVPVIFESKELHDFLIEIKKFYLDAKSHRAKKGQGLYKSLTLSNVKLAIRIITKELKKRDDEIAKLASLL